MSTLEIRKISITHLDVDCIVNAANSGLWEGGGVCGAIFHEAGSQELQKACDAIGGCAVGSAVITPGFHLKAKYIIHAVGPQWTGGTQRESKLLYNCYQAAMKLAQDHGCHTIGFPLISTGIYGYPQAEAWKVALAAVRDYQVEHNTYELNAIFAVLSDDVFAMGNTILSTVTQQPSTPAACRVVCFHKPDDENGYLSNWFIAQFSVNGNKYCCVEQYIMEQKALLFGNVAIAKEIMQTDSPQEMQTLGRKVQRFEPVVWNGCKQLIAYKGLLQKFIQNPNLREQLISTGNTMLVECSLSDKIWGAGCAMHDDQVSNPQNWHGQNLLGFALQAVRSELTSEAIP